MKTYLVKSYDKLNGAHKCTVTSMNGQVDDYMVDLLVNGDFPKDTNPEDLVGKVFKAKYDYPYIAIAMDVNPEPITECKS